MVEYLGILYTQMNNAWVYISNGVIQPVLDGSVVSILDAIFYGW